MVKDDEPIIVEQTAEPEHLADPQKWFNDCTQSAAEKGGQFFRYSSMGEDNPMALLFEAWSTAPKDQGDQRWAVTNDPHSPNQ